MLIDLKYMWSKNLLKSLYFINIIEMQKESNNT